MFSDVLTSREFAGGTYIVFRTSRLPLTVPAFRFGVGICEDLKVFATLANAAWASVSCSGIGSFRISSLIVVGRSPALHRAPLEIWGRSLLLVPCSLRSPFALQVQVSDVMVAVQEAAVHPISLGIELHLLCH